MRKLFSFLSIILALTLGFLVCIVLMKILYLVHVNSNHARYSETDTTTIKVSSSNNREHKQGHILSSFFGLDDSLPMIADFLICREASGKDGIPVVFSHQIDVDTLDPGDFQVVNENSEIKPVHCLSLAPATDAGEQRTVLLVGDFGNRDEQPVRIKVTGNILSINGEINFQGATAAITPLEQGPRIVFAERVVLSEWRKKQFNMFTFLENDTKCPSETKQVLRVVWSGGITTAPSIESYEKIRQKYIVRISNTNQPITKQVSPIGLSDLFDGDNNHVLCLDNEEAVFSVSFPSGYLADPRGDKNPNTSVKLQ